MHSESSQASNTSRKISKSFPLSTRLTPIYLLYKEVRKINTEDYQYMLESAKEHLDELPTLYKNCLKEDEVPKRLTNKIRYFLTDIESSLDYIAFRIFNSYCTNHINPDRLESKRKRVNFPLFDSKSWFDKRVDEIFPGLRLERPDLIGIFESRQPFIKGKDYWLPIFNKLVNTNKHRELEKQQRKQTTHIAYGELPGVTIVNCTFENVGAPISYNDIKIDFINKTPYDSNFIANTTVDYYFKNTQLSVLPTLYQIYDGASAVIEEIDMNFEEV